MPRAPERWLYGPGLDLSMIAGVLALALLLGGAAAADPSLFVTVLALDLWLLAYPHVASTYTRIAFDRPSLRAHRFLLLGLPPLVLAGTAGVMRLGGELALFSLYYYWQSWHYTRQSYGIARAYHHRGGAAARDRLGDALVFAFPLWGLLHRAHQRPAEFYGAPFWVPAVPWTLLALVVARQARALPGHAPLGPGHALFVLSHVAITWVSYVAIPDITAGWLFINIWHNAQYLLFVWAANAREFRGGVDPARRARSWLCQPRHAAAYAGVCLALGAGFYASLDYALATATMPVLLVAHMTVNFHHYVVDAVIWRRPRTSGAGA
jgi:hypothetical protein